LHRKSHDDRERYRGFVERLVERMPHYSMVVRTLGVRTLLHSIAANLWLEDQWPALLADALRALVVAGDEPRPEELRAAASLAAVGLALLRTDVLRMSRRDEHELRYEKTARAVAGILEQRDTQQVETLAGELPGRLGRAAGVSAAEEAVEAPLHPLRGVDRAVRLLAEENGVAAHARGDATIVIDDPLPDFPEPETILALRPAGESGPVFAPGLTEDCRPVLGAWCTPWLVVEKIGPIGLPHGGAWNLGEDGTLYAIDRADLPRADLRWSAGSPRPPEVADLLEMADDDSET
jgi:hypothetical protein